MFDVETDAPNVYLSVDKVEIKVVFLFVFCSKQQETILSGFRPASCALWCVLPSAG